MIPLLKHLSKLKGIISIGSGSGEELKFLTSISEKIICFEPQKELFEILKTRSNNNILCFQKAILNKNGFLPFWQGQKLTNSSFLDLNPNRPGNHQKNIHEKKIFVNTTTLDNFFIENSIDCNNYDCIIMDVQGTELMVLEGSIKILKNINFIISELSYYPIYHKSVIAKELDYFVKQFGFIKKYEVEETSFMTNALYVKKTFN